MSEKAAGKPKATGKKSGSSSKSKSAGDSYLVRQSKAKKAVTEEELKKKEVITPEDVMALTEATKDYLCPKKANTFGIEFVRFKVRDMDSQQVLFEIAKPEESGETEEEGKAEGEEEDDADGRFIRYEFPPQVLHLKTLGATIEFVVGADEVRDFTMVERHFFRGLCLKDFDINFPFCMPNSRNTCEYIYELPELSAQQMSGVLAYCVKEYDEPVYYVTAHNELAYYVTAYDKPAYGAPEQEARQDDIIAAPFETKSDSFYFVEGKLVMHNKAEYAYNARL